MSLGQEVVDNGFPDALAVPLVDIVAPNQNVGRFAHPVARLAERTEDGSDALDLAVSRKFAVVVLVGPFRQVDQSLNVFGAHSPLNLLQKQEKTK